MTTGAIETRRARRAAIEAGAPRRLESDSGRLPRFPASARGRLGFILLVALPGVAVTVVTQLLAPAELLDATANAQLLDGVAAIRADALGLDDLIGLYPPITTLLALAIPDPIALGVIGSLASAYLTQRVVEWLMRRGISRMHRVVLALALAATPITVYLATTNLQGIVGLMCFGIGVIDVVRFVKFANTQAGFRGGLLLAASALSDAAGLLSVVLVILLFPFLRHSRKRSWAANSLVIAFPTAAAFAGVALLDLVFGINPFGWIADHLHFSAASLDSLVAWLAGPAGVLLAVPVVIGMALVVALKNPALILVPPLLIAMLLAARVVGLAVPSASITALDVLLLVGIALVPTDPGRRQRALITVAALVILVDAWLLAFQVPAVAEVIDVLFVDWWR